MHTCLRRTDTLEIVDHKVGVPTEHYKAVFAAARADYEENDYKKTLYLLSQEQGKPEVKQLTFGGGETECVFENVYKEGALTVNVVDRNGVSIDYQVAKEDNNIIVTFEPLEEVATVSIVIQ